MNYKEIGDQFDQLCRLAGLTGYSGYKNEWLNQSNLELCEEFEIPSLKILETFNSSDGAALNCFPYVYDGTDVSIYFDGRRLDYQPEEALDLTYERRTGYRGRVQHYDWAGIINSNTTGSVPYTTHGVLLENRSPVVRSVGAFTFVAAHENQWCRFGPWTDGDGNAQNAGEYGYKIIDVTAGVATLEEHYRGPSSTITAPAPIDIRPKETQVFRTYGISDDSTKEFDVKCFRRPRRLYNPEDVPEWPRLGLAIAYMGVCLGLRHLEKYEQAEIWRRDAYNFLGTIKRRRRQVETTSPDLPQGRIGRRTGLTSRYNPRYGGIR